MKQHVWKLQDAKSRFSRVVENAITQGPQIITRYGTEAVIVLSYEEYRWMFMRQRELFELIRESPTAGADNTCMTTLDPGEHGDERE